VGKPHPTLPGREGFIKCSFEENIKIKENQKVSPPIGGGDLEGA